MDIVLRAYGTRNADVFVTQTGGFEDFGFIDVIVVLAQRGFVKWRKPLFLGLGLGVFLLQRTW